MENNSNNIKNNTNNMEYNLNISKEAKKIIKNFVELGIKKSETNDYEEFGEDASLLLEDSMIDSLFVSLYSMQPYAKQEVLEVLKTDIVNLSEYLSAEEIEILQNELQEVMRYCFSAKNKHTFGNIYIDGFFPMPTSLFELCTKMASPTPDSNILLPYSYPEMFASFRNELNFDGYVSSIEEWGFSQIMADVFNFKAMVKNYRISEVPNNALKQYDYIFAFPPMFPTGVWFYSDLVLLINDFLKDNGMMFCLLPYEFLFMPIWGDSRKMLVDSSLEIKVIKLPNHLNFKFIHNESCLLCIKKMHSDNFTLIDATNFQSMDCSHHVTTLPRSEAELLLETIEKNKEKIVWQGTATDLTEDNDFRPEIYLMEKELPIPHDGDELMALSELVEIVECINKDGDADRDSSYIEVRPLDFMSDYLHSGIDPEKMSVRTEDAKRLLTSDSLLFSVAGRVSRFSYSSRTVALDKRIIPFRLKACDVITEEFLLRALTLKETLKQVRVYMHYSGELSERDFLRIKIIVPAVERQKEFCLEDAREFLSESDLKLLDEQKNFRRDIHMKIHTIGQTIFNIDNLMDGLQTMRQRGNGVVSDSDVYGIKNPISVANIYDNLKNAIERLKRQVASFDRGYNKVPKDIALTDFIEDYIKDHQYTDFRYEYESEKHRFPFSYKSVIDAYYDDNGNPIGEKYNPDEYYFKKGDPIEWVKFPPEALTIIFDNIISNARAHGFSGREGGDNKVKIEIEQDDTNYVITIANNGKPLHPQLEEKYVFTYGITSQTGSNHSGIGAHEVSELMREFGGRAEFISTPNEEYTVTYRLTFTETGIIKLF